MRAIFDLDGCMCDCDARVSRYLTLPVSLGEPKDWAGLFSDTAIMSDLPIFPAIRFWHMLRWSGAHCEIWTGRPEYTRPATERWLRQWIEPPEVMRMRPDGDYTQDHILKARWLDDCGFVPDLVLEDRARIVAMYRARGVMCWQTAAGDF